MFVFNHMPWIYKLHEIIYELNFSNNSGVDDVFIFQYSFSWIPSMYSLKDNIVETKISIFGLSQPWNNMSMISHWSCFQSRCEACSIVTIHGITRWTTETPEQYWALRLSECAVFSKLPVWVSGWHWQAGIVFVLVISSLVGRKVVWFTDTQAGR